ncbi:MAG: IS200/IS605 family transposase, partial [Phycisphaerae bacterium]|nr:IS200/IS605 family transposase [Phycisphaerae bacterium]
RNVYSEINLHMTWHTKENAAVLIDRVENRTHHYLRHRAIETPGVIVHAIGGTVDHVHLAVSIPPGVTISEWIGQLKGSSSYHINHEICNRKILGWQDGYGVVSFGTRDLPWVVAYVRNQKKHHAEGTTHDRLERTDLVDPPLDRSDTNSDGSRDGDEETR